VARAIVTGAGGFIGSHLCERLIRDGNEVRALARYTSHRSLGNLDHVSSEIRNSLDISFVDLLDQSAIRSAIRGVDTVYHLAAAISVPYSYEAPWEFIAANVSGTFNVLEAVRHEQVGRMVHMSSSEVYGTARYTPIDEAHPLQAQSPYSATKIGADKVAESFHLAFDVPVITARPFNTFGPRQSLRAVIPTVVTQAILSDRVRVGSTFPRRDFVYVDDTVDALVRFGASADGAGEVFNIGTGKDISVAELIALVETVLGKSIDVESESDRVRPANSEVGQLLADASRAKEVFGWRPAHSFEEGLRLTVDWFREHAEAVAASEYVV
jgi:dTDP-glucose 4,6-dehydratase